MKFIGILLLFFVLFIIFSGFSTHKSGSYENLDEVRDLIKGNIPTPPEPTSTTTEQLSTSSLPIITSTSTGTTTEFISDSVASSTVSTTTTHATST